MSPLRKYMPLGQPPKQAHPVDMVINFLLAVEALGIVYCLIRIANGS